MKVLLVWPPQASLLMPFLALPALAARLRADGHEVDLLDLNLASNLRLLRPESLAACERRLDDRLAAGAPPEAVAAARGGAAAVCTGIPAALAGLRDPRHFAEPAWLERDFATLSAAYGLLSAAHWPTVLLQDLRMRYAPLRPDEALAAAGDAAENPFVADFGDHERARILAARYDLIGLSVAYESQWIPALTFIQALGRAGSRTPLVLGGGLMTRWAPRFLDLGWLPPGVDYVVAGEGETALSGLLGWLSGAAGAPTALTAVPHLLWRSAGQVRASEMQVIEDVSALPPPDFAGLPLGDYLTPEPVVPWLTSRGCYWGRCAFCTHRLGYRCFRMARPATLATQLRHVVKQTGARLISCVDEALPPATQGRLADLVADEFPGLSWYADVRLEPTLTPAHARRLAAGGCCMLIFGLESGSQRVLDHMRKGTRLDAMERGLHAAHEAGIATAVMLFVGFPTESQQEAMATLAFVERNRAAIDHVAVGAFSLRHGSPVQAAPGDYGVTGLRALTDDLGPFATAYDYTVRQGLTLSAAQRVAEALERRFGADPKFGRPTTREVAALRAAHRLRGTAAAGPGPAR